MNLSITQNRPAFISILAAGVLGVAELVNWHNFGEQLGWATDPQAANFMAINLLYLAAPGIALVGAGLIVYLGLTRFNPLVNLFCILGVSFVTKQLPNIIWFFEAQKNGLMFDSSMTKDLLIWSDYNVWSTADSALRWLWLVPMAFALVALFSNKGGVQVATSGQGYAFDPNTGEPIVSAVAGDGLKVSSLPLVALILAIFMPLVGLILAYVSLGQIKRHEVSKSNESQARLAMILGWVFTTLGVVAGILMGIAYATYFANNVGMY